MIPAFSLIVIFMFIFKRRLVLNKYKLFSPYSTKTSIKIVEVGPRDGLQNEKSFVKTSSKLKFIQLLLESGIKCIESTSFVSPKWVPQMADSKEIIEGVIGNNDLLKDPDVTYPVLIPNLIGFEKFMTVSQGKLDNIAVFTAASESFSQKNTNCSIKQSMERIKEVIRAAQSNNINVRGYISCITHCPHEGRTDPDAVTRLSNELLESGCSEVSLGDTIGAATSGDIRNLLNHLTKTIRLDKLAIHCHDTYGQALANILTAIEMGIRTVDSSCAGLGGCPYAPGASGNVSTEDLVYMLQGSGWDCGVDLNKLLIAGNFITTELNIKTRSKVAQALNNKIHE